MDLRDDRLLSHIDVFPQKWYKLTSDNKATWEMDLLLEL
jgi:hypothetical protein